MSRPKPGVTMWDDGNFKILYLPKRRWHNSVKPDYSYVAYAKVYRSWTRIGQAVNFNELVTRIKLFKQRIVEEMDG